jgi:hypothetical protein
VNGLSEIGTVDVGNEPKRHGSVAVMLQCLIGHDWSEIRATDTNVDDVANALASVTFPRAASHAVGEVGHLVENGVDLRDNVLAINNDRCPFRCAQSYMQNRAVFRDVDLVAPKHCVDPPAQSRFLGELHQKLQSLVGDAIL